MEVAKFLQLDIKPTDDSKTIIKKSSEESQRLLNLLFKKLIIPFAILKILTYGYLGYMLFNQGGFQVFWGLVFYISAFAELLKLILKPLLTLLLKWYAKLKMKIQ